MDTQSIKWIAIIPHYRHIKTLPQVIEALRQYHLPILVVDDGSGEAYQDELKHICREISLLCLPQNGGKGHAMKHGFRYATEHGYTHALQIDADAQHSFGDISKLLLASEQNPDSIICTYPIYDDSVPKTRLYGRKITNFWNFIHTGSWAIKDGMCGFRVYPLAPTIAILNHEYLGNRMDFDNEILIHFYWRNLSFVWIDTPVRYSLNGISHFHAWQDNWLISKMHARLFFRMLKQHLRLHSS